MNAIQFPGISQGIGKRGDILLYRRPFARISWDVQNIMLRCRKHYPVSVCLDSCVWVNISLEGFGLTIKALKFMPNKELNYGNQSCISVIYIPGSEEEASGLD